MSTPSRKATCRYPFGIMKIMRLLHQMDENARQEAIRGNSNPVQQLGCFILENLAVNKLWRCGRNPENSDSARGVIAELKDGVLPEWVKGGLPSKVNIKDHAIVMEAVLVSITMS